MPAYTNKLKYITFELATTQFECQLSEWEMQNNSDDGDKVYTFCPDGETREEMTPDYALDLKFQSDWRVAGISDFLWANDDTQVPFTLMHHPGGDDEVQWSGTVVIKAPNVGGAARETEMTEVTLQVLGKPLYVGPS